jgi:hypothetical protein
MRYSVILYFLQQARKLSFIVIRDIQNIAHATFPYVSRRSIEYGSLQN